MIKRQIFLILSTLATVASLNAYEESRGNIKIVLNEELGTFSFYDVTNPENPISLLLDRDPRTSGLFVLVDDKVYHMNSNSTFEQTLEERKDGVAYVWSSPSLAVTLEFLFRQSPASNVEDGLVLRAFVHNTSGRSQKVGVRFLFDTYLGEKHQKHFYLAGGEGIAEEKNFPPSLPSYWVSGDPSRGTAFQVMVELSNISRPSQIAFANWKRLETSSWIYQGRKRSFNYLPYSVNDSAVSHWYQPRNVENGKTRTVDLHLSLYTAEDFPSGTEIMAGEDPYPPVDWSNPDAVLSSIREDMERVNEVLLKVEKAIIAKEETGPEAMRSLDDEVEDLRARKDRYVEE